MLKSAYRKGRNDKYGPDFCDGERPDKKEEGSCLGKLIGCVILLALAIFMYFAFIRKTPYCEVRDGSDPAEHCNYEELGVFAKCRPCPWNAQCAGTEMVRHFAFLSITIYSG